MLAKRVVGATGTVRGIDPSSAMIARARMKAMKSGVEVLYDIGVAESLDFPDAQFDVVLSTVMLHHLPKAIRLQAAQEMRRVLKPGGRVVAIDFVRGARKRKGLLAHFRVHRHGRVDARDLEALVRDAGFDVADSGALGKWDLQYVVGVR
jgi:ubiquinone/menaquinone biosynthesis C-methylase UbiE